MITKIKHKPQYNISQEEWLRIANNCICELEEKVNEIVEVVNKIEKVNKVNYVTKIGGGRLLHKV